jgi:hypothetical protein
MSDVVGAQGKAKGQVYAMMLIRAKKSEENFSGTKPTSKEALIDLHPNPPVLRRRLLT